MSADNWTKCPQCQRRKLDAVSAARELYGKVPVEQYEAKLAEAREQVNDASDESLREDYSIGTWRGVFRVEYSSRCTSCGYSKEFQHEEPA